MPIFTRPDAEIHYEVHGSGYPLLLFAPGGPALPARVLAPQPEQSRRPAAVDESHGRSRRPVHRDRDGPAAHDVEATMA